MAGTNRTRIEAGEAGEAPAIILVEPQLGENIGSVARAMLNFGLTDLRLVNPRDGWPNPSAKANASGADSVLMDATVFDSVEEAVADLSTVLAATARPRDLVTEIVTPQGAAARLRAAIGGGERAGMLFGRESTGLDNDSIALADAVVNVPCNPGFSSLNLGMAVLLLSYEWFQFDDATPRDELRTERSKPADKKLLVGLFEHLEGELDACGFLRVTEKRPSMVRNLRAIFQRARLTEQEVRTLRGVISGLVEFGRKRPTED
jgi:tRNA/rRNA methyltransferase